MDPTTSSYVQTVAETLRSALGPDLLGIYLVGSAAMGGFDSLRSDVDIVAVVSRRVEPQERTRIVDLLSHPALPCPVRKLELVVYPLDALRDPTPSLGWDLNLNTGPEVGVISSVDPASEPSHWFVLDAAMARDHAEPLFGPPPAEVFAEIDETRVLQALLDSVRWHRQHDEEGVQSVLNACRAWRYLIERTWVPKPDAARWARTRAQDPSVIDAALEATERDAGTRIDREAVRRFLGDVERRLLETIATAP